MTDDRITYWPSSGSVGLNVNGMRVLISHGDTRSSQHNKEQLALELLERGSAIQKMQEEQVKLEQWLAARTRELAEVRSKLPPASPLRLFGAGIIRVDERGFPWVMNKPEPDRAWGTHGIRFDDWDDLFRHLNVRITCAGVDANGPFFRFEVPPREEATRD